MEQLLTQNAQAYATRHQRRLAERLGFGIHGIIFRTEGNPGTNDVATAVKAHRFSEPYARELSVYQCLREAETAKILGFNVPQLLGHDDELRVIEMSIVTRPFVLDFAGAYLDAPPEFSDEIWAEWEAEKINQFEVRWTKVREILAALEQMDIYMADVSPSNIAFLD
jgi:hypothetical protein